MIGFVIHISIRYTNGFLQYLKYILYFYKFFEPWVAFEDLILYLPYLKEDKNEYRMTYHKIFTYKMKMEWFLCFNYHKFFSYLQTTFIEILSNHLGYIKQKLKIKLDYSNERFKIKLVSLLFNWIIFFLL